MSFGRCGAYGFGKRTCLEPKQPNSSVCWPGNYRADGTPTMQASWVARSAGLLVDHVAKGSMLGWLLAWPALQPLFLYAWHFYGSPSTCRGLTRRGRRTRSDKGKARNRVTVNPLCQHSIPRCSTKLCPSSKAKSAKPAFRIVGNSWMVFVRCLGARIVGPHTCAAR